MTSSSVWQQLKSAAVLAKSQGDLSNAIRLMNEAIAFSRKTNVNSGDIATMMNYLSSIYFEVEDYANAENVIRESITLSLAADSILQGDNYLTLSIIQCKLDMFDDAISIAEIAKTMYQKCSHFHGVRMANINIEWIKNCSLQRSHLPNSSS